jgi:hypothetical protein
MANGSIVIARRNGVLHGPDGERYPVRSGRTLADADHPVVALYPKVWVPVNITLRTPDGAGTDQPTPDADTWDPAREGAQNTEGEPSEEMELAAQFRRLATALRDRNALTDGPLTAAEVVDQVMAIIDEWQMPKVGPVDDEPEADPRDALVGREEVRAWAKLAGLAVADKGRLAKEIYAAYHEAH